LVVGVMGKMPLLEYSASAHLAAHTPPWRAEGLVVQSTTWLADCQQVLSLRGTAMLLKNDERLVKAVISPPLGRRWFFQQVLLRTVAPPDLKASMQLPSLL